MDDSDGNEEDVVVVVAADPHPPAVECDDAVKPEPMDIIIPSSSVVAEEVVANDSGLEITEASENEQQVDEEEVWEDNHEEPFHYVAPEEFDFDDNFDGDEEELYMMLMQLNLSDGAQTQFPSATIEELPEESVEPVVAEEEVRKVQAPPAAPTLPFLQTTVKFPEVYWSQSDDMIKLRISAADVEDYTIDVATDHLILQ